MMNKKYLAVSEFAKLAGVSKQAIYQRLNTSLKDFVKVEQGRKVVDSAALSLFMPDNTCDKDETPAQSESTLEQELIQVLKSQLEAKDSQIAELQTALLAEQANNKQLLSQLSAAQALHAGTLQQQLIEQQPPQEEASPADHIGIFTRIYDFFRIK